MVWINWQIQRRVKMCSDNKPPIFLEGALHDSFISAAAAAAAKSLQSCPTLCDPIDGSTSGSPVLGILQARTLEWVAISSSNAWKWKVKVKTLSCVRPSATPWTAAFQAPQSMGFSRHEYWSGMPLPSPAAMVNKTDPILLQDNAHPHVTQSTVQKLNELDYEVLPHLPYWPDL